MRDLVILAAVARRRMLLSLRNGWFAVAIVAGVGLTAVAVLSCTRRADAVERELAALGRRDAAVLAQANLYAHVTAPVYRVPPRLARLSWGIGEGAGSYARVRGLYGDTELRAVEEVGALSLTFDLDPARAVGIGLALLAVFFTHGLFNGDRQAGVARFVFAFPASRVTLLLGELLGQTAALLLVLAPMAAATVFLLRGLGDRGSADFWLGWAVFWLLAGLYAMVWVTLGTALSLVAKDPATSLAAGLSLWATATILLPGATAAAHPPPPHPSAATVAASPSGLSLLSPFSLFLVATDRLAGTDIDEQRQFVALVRLQQQQLMQWQRAVERDQPRRVRRYELGDPPLDLTRLPRLEWRGSTVAERLPATAAATTALLLWAAVPLLLSAWRMFAWDPR